MTSCHLSGTLYCSLTFQLYITVHFGAICTIVNLGLIEFGEKIGEFLTLCSIMTTVFIYIALRLVHNVMQGLVLC